MKRRNNTRLVLLVTGSFIGLALLAKSAEGATKPLTGHNLEGITIHVTAKSVTGRGNPFCIGAPMRHRSVMSAFFVPAFGRLSGSLRRAAPMRGISTPDSLPLIRVETISGSSQLKHRRT